MEDDVARLLKDLPAELVQLVLARLCPLHVLCRFRLVCKTWNHMITHPGFASLRAQASRRPSYVLITPKMLYLLDCREIVKSWEILDMAEKRFYTLNNSFFVDFDCWGLWTKHTLAVDIGLIYAMYFCFGLKNPFSVHVEHTSLSKSFHQILEPEILISFDRDIFVMAVDNATQSYRIITMEGPDDNAKGRREDVYVYDSRIKVWTKLCTVPGKHRAYSCIFLKGVFYTLFVDTSLIPWCPKLYSCDLETGAWSYIDVELPNPSCLQDKSLLVLSLGRLFFVEYTGLPRYSSYHKTCWEVLAFRRPGKKKHVIKVGISEIRLGEREVVKVAEMPKFSKYPREMIERPHDVGHPVVALGCGDSIVISSLIGRCVGFDLLKNCWHELPANTTGYTVNTTGADRGSIYASLVDF